MASTRTTAESIVPAEALDAARSAGLHYVTDRSPGIRRMKCGRGFRYVTLEGRTLSDKDDLLRIRAAWLRRLRCASADTTRSEPPVNRRNSIVSRSCA